MGLYPNNYLTYNRVYAFFNKNKIKQVYNCYKYMFNLTYTTRFFFIYEIGVDI